MFSLSQFNFTCRKTSRTALLLLFFLVPGLACATIYECRKPDGTLFLTNNPDKIPPECQIISESAEEGMASPAAPAAVINSGDGRTTSRQEIPSQTNQSTPEDPQQSAASMPGETSGTARQVELKDYQRTAQVLADNYETIQESAMSPAEKAAALEKLDKYVWALRQSLESSNLSREERENLEGMLP